MLLKPFPSGGSANLAVWMLLHMMTVLANDGAERAVPHFTLAVSEAWLPFCR